jgi:SAM-dependent methyltransferase
VDGVQCPKELCSEEGKLYPKYLHLGKLSELYNIFLNLCSTDPKHFMNKIKKQERLGSPERFGYEWEVYSEINDKYEEQFNQWTKTLKKEEWEGKSFLDVGCGMGRNSYWAFKYRASKGVSIDIDDRSLMAAQKNLHEFQNSTIKRCSVYDISYVNEFDIAFSIGVIHHLKIPQIALEKMVKSVKPGGIVLIWLYGYEKNQWIVWFFNPFRKYIFSILPIRIVHLLSIVPTVLLWCFLRVRIYKLEYFKMLRKFSFSHLRSIVFDQMLPRIAKYYRKEEAFALMKDASLTDIRIEAVNQMSWSVMGTKKK